MSNIEPIVINGQEYFPTFENGEIISLLRFNQNHRMWVKVNFSNSEAEVERDLLHQLRKVYIRKEVESNNQLINNKTHAITKVV